MHDSDMFLLSRMKESAQQFLGVASVDPPPVVDRTIREGEIIRVGKLRFEVFETPGHTPGSVCLAHTRSVSLFCGDLVFSGGGVGRTDFSYSDREGLEKSIDRIMRYPAATALYCGHGPMSTVGKEAPHHRRKQYP
jgi:glyoxylase-like metal-dependent hydrolase (beta-lactamase superfamily II)